MTPTLFDRCCVFLYGDDYTAPMSKLLHVSKRNIRFFRNGSENAGKPIPPGIAREVAQAVRKQIIEADYLRKELDACG